MARQQEMFDKPKVKRRVIMHLEDAGTDCGYFVCRRCGFNEWYKIRTVTEGRRGVPCPNCNND